MSAAELLLDLGRRGIQLEADGQRLRYFPRSALTPDLLNRLKSQKGELLAILAARGQKPRNRPNRRGTVWASALDRLEATRCFRHTLWKPCGRPDARWIGDVQNCDLATEPVSEPLGPTAGQQHCIDPDVLKPCSKCGNARTVAIAGWRSIRQYTRSMALHSVRPAHGGPRHADAAERIRRRTQSPI